MKPLRPSPRRSRQCQPRRCRTLCLKPQQWQPLPQQWLSQQLPLCRLLPLLPQQQSYNLCLHRHRLQTPLQLPLARGYRVSC